MPGRLRQVPGMSSPQTLSGFLNGLKDSGCALLVTGDTDPETRAAVSEKLFGVPESELEANEPHRKRVLIKTEQRLRSQQYLPADVTGEAATCAVLDTADMDRSSTAVDSPSSDLDSSRRAGSTGLGEVAETVEQQIRELLESTVGPAPGELRVGCTSLIALEKRFEQDEVEGFAESLAQSARRNRGMCHLHYPAADASHPVRRLSTAVNARLEITTVGNRIYVTWHTPYENVDGADQPIDWIEM